MCRANESAALLGREAGKARIDLDTAWEYLIEASNQIGGQASYWGKPYSCGHRAAIEAANDVATMVSKLLEERPPGMTDVGILRRILLGCPPDTQELEERIAREAVRAGRLLKEAEPSRKEWCIMSGDTPQSLAVLAPRRPEWRIPERDPTATEDDLNTAAEWAMDCIRSIDEVRGHFVAGKSENPLAAEHMEMMMKLAKNMKAKWEKGEELWKKVGYLLVKEEGWEGTEFWGETHLCCHAAILAAVGRIYRAGLGIGVLLTIPSPVPLGGKSQGEVLAGKEKLQSISNRNTERKGDAQATERPPQPTKDYCLVRPNKLRWQGGVEVESRLFHLLELAIEAGDKGIPFERIKEEIHLRKEIEDKTIANEIYALNKHLLDIHFPWGVKPKGAHLVRKPEGP